MRDRPFIAGGESPRPFSEVRAERDGTDVELRRLDNVREDIARLEGDALEATDPEARKRLLCEAEALRSSLDEEFFRRKRR